MSGKKQHTEDADVAPEAKGVKQQGAQPILDEHGHPLEFEDDSDEFVSDDDSYESVHAGDEEPDADEHWIPREGAEDAMETIKEDALASAPIEKKVGMELLFLSNSS